LIVVFLRSFCIVHLDRLNDVLDDGDDQLPRLVVGVAGLFILYPLPDADEDPLQVTGVLRRVVTLYDPRPQEPVGVLFVSFCKTHRTSSSETEGPLVLKRNVPETSPAGMFF